MQIQIPGWGGKLAKLKHLSPELDPWSTAVRQGEIVSGNPQLACAVHISFCRLRLWLLLDNDQHPLSTQDFVGG